MECNEVIYSVLERCSVLERIVESCKNGPLSRQHLSSCRTEEYHIWIVSQRTDYPKMNSGRPVRPDDQKKRTKRPPVSDRAAPTPAPFDRSGRNRQNPPRYLNKLIVIYLDLVCITVTFI